MAKDAAADGRLGDPLQFLPLTWPWCSRGPLTPIIHLPPIDHRPQEPHRLASEAVDPDVGVGTGVGHWPGQVAGPSLGLGVDPTQPPGHVPGGLHGVFAGLSAQRGAGGLQGK